MPVEPLNRRMSERTEQGILPWLGDSFGGYENAPQVVELDGNLLPGSFTKATFLRWDREKKQYIKTNVRDDVYDSLRANFAFHGEWLRVQDSNGQQRFEVIGSYGLIRFAETIEQIGPLASGLADIYLSGAASGLRQTVHHTAMTDGKTLAVGAEILIQWFRDEGPETPDAGYPLDRPGAWVIINSDCNFA